MYVFEMSTKSRRYTCEYTWKTRFKKNCNTYKTRVSNVYWFAGYHMICSLYQARSLTTKLPPIVVKQIYPTSDWLSETRKRRSLIVTGLVTDVTRTHQRHIGLRRQADVPSPEHAIIVTTSNFSVLVFCVLSPSDLR